MSFQADFLEENGYCVPDKWYMNAILDIFLHLVIICEVTNFNLTLGETLIRVYVGKTCDNLLQVSVPGETSKWSPRPQFASDWCSWTLGMFQWLMPSKWAIICIMKWPIAKDSKSVTYVTPDGCHTCKPLFGRHGHNMCPIVLVELRACLGDLYLQNEPSYAPWGGRQVIYLAYPSSPVCKTADILQYEPIPTQDGFRWQPTSGYTFG